MPNEDRFKQPVIALIAKRAANRCSNPDCGAITSGPSSEPLASINVGEAAHIYGANAGAARFDPAMSSADRSAISNAIWLCGNCHKLVDDDPTRFPAGLLFEWQREHEGLIASQIGKAGAEIRKRYLARHIEELGHLSYLAERLILEKDTLWEYRLTAEILRFEMAPVLQRWKALSRGMYSKPITRIPPSDFLNWVDDKNAELAAIVGAFSVIVNEEFDRAWGAPGEPGEDLAIVATCRLFAEMCQSALTWEEQVRFVTAEEIFLEVKDLFFGVAGGVIEEAEKLPKFLSEMLLGPDLTGEKRLHLVMSLPEGWDEKMTIALKRLNQKMIQEGYF